MNKPWGIKATAIYAALYGLISLFAGLLQLWIATRGIDQFKALSAEAILNGCFLLIAFYGIWSLRPWGRLMMIWFSILSIVLALFTLISNWHEVGIYPYKLMYSENIVMSSIIIFYLGQAHVKELFTTK